MGISVEQQQIIDDFAEQRANAVDGVISTGQADILSELEIRDEHDPLMAEQSSQLGRYGLQGLTFGFADEIEAMAKSLISGGDVDYVTARNEIRQKLAEYAEENGGKALLAEMAGAVVPTIFSLFGGPGGWNAALANMSRMSKSIFTAGRSNKSLLQVANRSGVATAVYAGGASEKEAFGEDADKLGLATDIATGYGFGATIGGTIAGVGKLVSPLVTKLMERAKTDKIDKAIRAELDRMVNKTGLTEDEIIRKVADGELIAENQSLLYYIKQVVAQSDTGKASNILRETMEGVPAIKNKVGETIGERVAGRPEQTRERLLTTMQESISRGTSKKNLLKAYKQTDAEFSALETKAYNKILKKNNKELDGEMTDVLLQSIRRFEGGAETINKMIAGDELIKKAFYTIDDKGLITLTRQPTIADAELIYRAIRNEKDRLWRSNQKDLSMVLSSNMHKLKTALNKFSPTLKNTRAKAHDLRMARDFYKQGRKVMSMLPEEVDELLENIAKHQSFSKKATIDAQSQMLQSLRDGLLIQLKGKDSIAISRNLANADKNLSKIISKVFPDESVDDILNQARIANQAQIATGKMPIGAGSPTQPLLDAGQAVGQARLLTGGGGGVGTGSSSSGAGDFVLAIARPLLRWATSRGIPEKEAIGIVEIVTSQNPTLVKKALVDDNAMNQLQKLMDAMITKGSEVTGEVVGKVRGTELAQDYDPASGLLQWAVGAGGNLVGANK